MCKLEYSLVIKTGVQPTSLVTSNQDDCVLQSHCKKNNQCVLLYNINRIILLSVKQSDVVNNNVISSIMIATH